MYGNNEDVPKIIWTICIQNQTYMMAHLGLCGMSLWQMKTMCQSTINELNFDFFANVPLCCAWNNMLGLMQYQVRSMQNDFSILQFARSTSWTGQHD